MQRVAIVGSGGAGKTTFANRLGETLGLPVTHLDEHYWQPGWTATPGEQWRDRQRRLIADDRWIIDGNYGSTLDLRLARADTVIILAYSRWRCLRGAGCRWAHHRGQAIQAKDCPQASRSRVSAVGLELPDNRTSTPPGGNRSQRQPPRPSDRATQSSRGL